MSNENSQNISITGSENVSIGDIKQDVTQKMSNQSLDKDKLQNLIKQLNEALQQIPPHRADEADAVAKSSEIFIQAASEEKPNRAMLEITGDGLKKAAKNIADVLPSALYIATQIIDQVLKVVR